MAACNITSSLIASIHPLVIMNISDHWIRSKAQNNNHEQRIFGALIGRQEGRNLEITDSFELLYDRIENDVIIDKTYYHQKENQFNQVFPDFDFLGWYTTGEDPDDSDIKVHKQICEINESPLLLKLDPLNDRSKLPVKMFESIIDIEKGETKMLFVNINFTITTEEAERIGFDHVAKLSANPQCMDSDSSVVSDSLGCTLNAVKMLKDRVSVILAYVNDTQNGTIPWNDEILREVNNLCHRLPVLFGKSYSEKFQDQFNDVALITYLSTITKACSTLNEFVNKFNILSERLGKKRKTRGYNS